MNKTKTTIYASSAQWAVLQWLFNYPGIYLSWDDMYSTFIHWTAAWVSEEARLHMLKVSAVLGIHGMDERTKPRIKPLKSGTPRCKFQTFKALLKEGLICRYVTKGNISESYYQLTSHMRKDLEEYELEKMMAGKE